MKGFRLPAVMAGILLVLGLFFTCTVRMENVSAAELIETETGQLDLGCLKSD